MNVLDRKATAAHVMRLSRDERGDLLAVLSRAQVPGGLLTLRANGKQLAAPDLDAMLARAVARERVELEVDLLAYEQGALDSDGKRTRNRNSVRFRDGAMMKLGRTGKATPYLRDHKQGDSTARGGTIIESRTEKVADGHYQILQTARLTEPTAVERALRGLMSTVSVGWAPTGPINCTLCGVEVLTSAWARECAHFPGDRDDESGEVAEWEYSEAELIETSEVPVPGVPTAGIEGIRAALSAAANRGAWPQETTDMSKLAGFAQRLGLAVTAGDDEIATAVTVALTERDALREQLAAEQRRTAEINARLATHEAQLAAQAEEAWISDGIKSGKVTKGAHEDSLRALFKVNPEGARAILAAAPVITPVGQPSQVQPVPATAAPQTEPAARAAFAAAGQSYDNSRRFARMFGAPDPDKALLRLVAEEG